MPHYNSSFGGKKKVSLRSQDSPFDLAQGRLMRLSPHGPFASRDTRKYILENPGKP